MLPLPLLHRQSLPEDAEVIYAHVENTKTEQSSQLADFQPSSIDTVTSSNNITQHHVVSSSIFEHRNREPIKDRKEIEEQQKLSDEVQAEDGQVNEGVNDDSKSLVENDKEVNEHMTHLKSRYLPRSDPDHLLDDYQNNRKAEGQNYGRNYEPKDHFREPADFYDKKRRTQTSPQAYLHSFSSEGVPHSSRIPALRSRRQDQFQTDALPVFSSGQENSISEVVSSTLLDLLFQEGRTLTDQLLSVILRQLEAVLTRISGDSLAGRVIPPVSQLPRADPITIKRQQQFSLLRRQQIKDRQENRKLEEKRLVAQTGWPVRRAEQNGDMLAMMWALF